MPEARRSDRLSGLGWRIVLVWLAVVSAVWVSASEYLHLRWIDRDDPARSMLSMKATQPWGGLAATEAARLLETRWSRGEEAAREALEWQLAHYPLTPWRWLLLSRIAMTVGAPEDRLADMMATAISVQPQNRSVRWQASNLAQSTGEPDLVLRQLRLLLEIDPRSIDQAIFIGSRWREDLDALLDAILPEGEPILVQAMRHARRSGSMALAEAIWTRLTRQRSEGPLTVDHPALEDYLHVAMRNDPSAAMAAWQLVDESYRPGDLPAGDFSWPKDVLPTFGWSMHTPDSVTVERVSLDADSSMHGLSVRFSGEKNIRLTAPAVRFPAAEPGLHRLRGWWRAQGLTTRALPYLSIESRSGDKENRIRERLEVPSQAFGWQPFEFDIRIREPGQLVVFRLRRDRTDAFDRYIEGEIVLAGLSFERLLHSASMAASRETPWDIVKEWLERTRRGCDGDDQDVADCRRDPDER